MKALKLALKKHPIVYIARDLERALGLTQDYSDYYIITNKSPLSQKPNIKNQKNIISIKNTHSLDTHELLTHTKTISFLKKLTDPQILVFKTNPLVEKICQEQGWHLLNPPSELSTFIEGKVSQIEWLGDLSLLLPPHRIDKLSNLIWQGKKFIIQYNNRVHTGESTVLITSSEQLHELQKKFPERMVRTLQFIEGIMFTNNNIVWGKKILCGNINYQITGLQPFTDQPFATIGNDWGLPHKLLSKKLQHDYFKIAKLIGQKLIHDGWRGLFGIDVILEKRTNKLYLIEVNARQPASTTYESQLQERQKSKIKNQKFITTFEAHLASLLNLKEEKNELIQISDGAQIIQRVPKNAKDIKINKQTLTKLQKLHCNIIMYDNDGAGSDLLRIQSTKSIMQDHNQFNELGEKIKMSS